MSKNRLSKTAQGFRGMNAAQAMQIKRNEKQSYFNCKTFTNQYQIGPDTIKMPLNRSMRRYAKRMKINIEKA
ncbi:TPA: hypothetical protein ACHWHD_002771 [Providencia stuartii]